MAVGRKRDQRYGRQQCGVGRVQAAKAWGGRRWALGEGGWSGHVPPRRSCRIRVSARGTTWLPHRAHHASFVIGGSWTCVQVRPVPRRRRRGCVPGPELAPAVPAVLEEWQVLHPVGREEPRRHDRCVPTLLEPTRSTDDLATCCHIAYPTARGKEYQLVPAICLYSASTTPVRVKVNFSGPFEVSAPEARTHPPTTSHNAAIPHAMALCCPPSTISSLSRASKRSGLRGDELHLCPKFWRAGRGVCRHGFARRVLLRPGRVLTQHRIA